MKAYSLDLRTRVLAAIQRGMPRTEIIQTFQISRSSLKRWYTQYQMTGDLAPARPTGGPNRRIGPDDESTVRQYVQTTPDATLADHAAHWNAEHTTTVSVSTIGRAIRRLGITRKKKTVIACERDPWKRALFAVRQQDLDPADVVVIDEVGSTVNLTTTYARAPRGERVVAHVPRNTPKTTTTISAMTLHGMGPHQILTGSVTAAIFEAYVEQVLCPTLRPKQVVLVDNLSAHKRARVRELIEACDCDLQYLPPYSPDFSPIELAFAKIKNTLRRVGARTHEALTQAITDAFATISPTDAHAFFQHCGFRIRPDMAQWFCS